MTTPERLRARQVREGVVLIVLGVFMTISTLYFEWQDREQQRVDSAQESCFQDNFVELSRVLELRALLAQEETNVRQKLADAEKAIWMTYAEAAGIIKDDPTKPLPPEEEARLQRQLVKNLLEYREIANEVRGDVLEIQAERRRNPVPPYPVGACTKEE